MTKEKIMRRSVCRNVIKQALVLIVACACNTAFAQQSAGVVTHLSGTLSVKRGDGSARLLAIKSEIVEGDLLNTEDGSYARVKFVDGAEVVLKPNTNLLINKYHYQEANPAADSAVISLIKGGFRSVTGFLGKRNPRNVSINTSTATIGIRGTHLGVLDCQGNSCANIQTISGAPLPEGVHIDVAEGRIVIANSAGEQEIGAGQFAYIKDLSTLPVVVPPNQGIRVTMPSSISQNNASGNTVGSTRASSACAM